MSQMVFILQRVLAGERLIYYRPGEKEKHELQRME